jgi:WD40 repeat protein
MQPLTWVPNGRMVASGGDDQRVCVWQSNGSLLFLSPVTAPVHAIAWSPDSHSIGVGAGNTLSFFDAQTGALLTRIVGQQAASVTALGWTGGQTSPPCVIAAGTDRTATVWNGQSHLPQVVFRRHTTAIEALTVLGETVATASQGGVIRVWSAASGQALHGYYAETLQPFRAIAFSSTGALATMAGTTTRSKRKNPCAQK